MKNSNIEWTDHTFNPWIGCTQVSPGCAFCYAMIMMARRYGRVKWGKGEKRARTSKTYWRQPIRWNREENERRAIAHGLYGKCDAERPRVFCASLADWLDDEVPIEWLADLLGVILQTQSLDWLLLTKRPENWLPRLRAVAQLFNEQSFDGKPHDEMLRQTCLWVCDWVEGNAPANVWIGTTVEDQRRADERVPLLLAIPARVRFLSVEPMLEEIGLGLPDRDFNEKPTPVIDWVICGGESGPGARPFVAEWAWSIALQCRSAGVAFFMKQLGENARADNFNAMTWPEETRCEDIAGPGNSAFASTRVRTIDKKGGNIDEFPEELRVREFPKPV